MEYQKYLALNEKMATVYIIVVSTIVLSVVASLSVLMIGGIFGLIGIELAKGVITYSMSVAVILSIIAFFIGLVMNILTITK